MRLLPFLPNARVASLVMSFLHGGKDHIRLVIEYRTLLLWHDYLNSDWHNSASRAIPWDRWRRSLIQRGHDWLQLSTTNPHQCRLARLPERFGPLKGQEDDLNEAVKIASTQFAVRKESRPCCSEGCITDVPVFRDNGAAVVSDALQYQLHVSRGRVRAVSDC